MGWRNFLKFSQCHPLDQTSQSPQTLYPGQVPRPPAQHERQEAGDGVVWRMRGTHTPVGKDYAQHHGGCQVRHSEHLLASNYLVFYLFLWLSMILATSASLFLDILAICWLPSPSSCILIISSSFPSSLAFSATFNFSCTSSASLIVTLS